MQNYHTIEEKAFEWNISIRHVQYLCRQGKIKNAIKRAGAWFIPDDAPIPTKNTKKKTSNSIHDFRFVGTKKEIFNYAITLFRDRGFNDVSFKDIANGVGIRPSTIYNYFKSKQEILDIIYDYYSYYYAQERKSLAEMENVVREKSILEIIGHIRYEFKEEYRQRMIDISTIILQRIYVDYRAKEIVNLLMLDEGIEYVEAVLNYAVNIGRLAPFDTHIMAVYINMVRLFTLYYWIIDPSPDNRMKILEDEQMLYKYALKVMVDLKPTLG